MTSPSSVPKPVFPSCSKRIHFAICDLPFALKPASFECAAYLTVFLTPAAAIMHCIIGGAANVGYRWIAIAGKRRAISGRMPMRNGKWSRPDALKVSAASAAGLVFAEPLRAAAPPPTAVTPALIEVRPRARP
jgi:hypothetical protein